MRDETRAKYRQIFFRRRYNKFQTQRGQIVIMIRNKHMRNTTYDTNLPIIPPFKTINPRREEIPLLIWPTISFSLSLNCPLAKLYFWLKVLVSHLPPCKTLRLNPCFGLLCSTFKTISLSPSIGLSLVPYKAISLAPGFSLPWSSWKALQLTPCFGPSWSTSKAISLAPSIGLSLFLSRPLFLLSFRALYIRHTLKVTPSTCYIIEISK